MDPLLSSLDSQPILTKGEIENLFKPVILDQLLEFHSNLYNELQKLCQENPEVENFGSVFAQKVNYEFWIFQFQLV